MPAQTATPMFIFTEPMSRPSARKSAKAKKEVRSHVTTIQHRRRKQQQQQQQKQQERLVVETARQREEEAERSLPETTSELVKRERGKEVYVVVGEGGSEEESPPPPASPSQSQPVASANQILTPNISTSADLFNPLTSPFRDGSLALQLFLLDDSSNHVMTTLSDLGTDLPSVMKTYQSFALNDAVAYEQEYPHLTQPGTAQSYLPKQLFQDPALIVSWIFLALSFDRPGKAFPSSSSPSPPSPLLKLRGHLLRSINTALDDPVRGISDYIISAVLVLAIAEATTDGGGEQCLLHMRGLREMVRHRGGLGKLGHGGCISAYILWQENRFAKLVESREET